MADNRVAKFARINLGDYNNSGSDEILDLALGGADVVFPVSTQKIEITILEDTTDDSTFTISSAGLEKDLVVSNDSSRTSIGYTQDSANVYLRFPPSLDIDNKRTYVYYALSYITKQGSAGIAWVYDRSTGDVVGTYDSDTAIVLTLTNGTSPNAWSPAPSVDNNTEVFTFKGDGSLLDISDIPSNLLFTKTSVTLTLSSADLTLLSKVNAYKYNNKPVEVWWGTKNDDGTISNAKKIFSGYCDSHTVDKKSIKLKVQSVWARFEQTRGDRTASSTQKSLIEDGVFGVPTNTVDKGFDFIDRDYSSLVLGKVPARNVTTRGGRRYGIFGPRSSYTNTIPGRPGDNVTDTGSEYIRSLVYGRADVQPQLLHAFNPAPASVRAAYPKLNGNSLFSNTTSDTQYITLVYALAEGDCGDLLIETQDVTYSNTGPISKFAYLTDGGDTSFVNYTYTSSGKTGSAIAVEYRSGKYDQTAIQNVVDMDPNNDWTANHRCLGTAIVAVTIEASTLFPSGIPVLSFNVGGRLCRKVEKSGNDYSLSPIATSGRFIQNQKWLAWAGKVNGYDPTSFASQQWYFSQSPSRAILDIITNQSYGLGIPLSQVNLKSFYEANLNEEDISTDQAGNYYTDCRGVFQGALTFRETISQLLQVGKANLSWVDGQITIIPNKYLGTDAATKLAVATINEDDILGGLKQVKFSPQGSSTVYNRVAVTAPVINSSGDQQSYTLTVKDDNAFKQDSYQKSELNLTLPMAGVFLDANGDPAENSKEILVEAGRIRLRASRLFVEGAFDLDYWTHKDIIVGTVLNLSNKRFNWTGAATKLIKVKKVTYSKLGTMKVEWKEFSNLIYDDSDTDITSIERTSFNTSRFNTPETFYSEIPELLTRTDFAFSASSDGTNASFPSGLSLGTVDGVKIVLADAADSDGDEMFLKKLVSTSGNSFLHNTGTATGLDLSFRGSAANGTTGSTVRLAIDQSTNTTVVSQVDAAVAAYNAIGVLGSSTFTTIGNFILQRNSYALKLNDTSWILLRLTTDSQTVTPSFVLSVWNSGSPTVTNENYPYTEAIEGENDIYIGTKTHSWPENEAEPNVSTDNTGYSWRSLEGKEGKEGPKGDKGDNSTVAGDTFRTITIYKSGSSTFSTAPTNTDTVMNGDLTSLSTNTATWSLTPTVPGTDEFLYTSSALFKQTNSTGGFVISGTWGSTVLQLTRLADVYKTVYIIATSKPSVPANSSGVPTGYSETAPTTGINVVTVDGTNETITSLWKTTGKQTAGVGNFTWGNLIKDSVEPATGFAEGVLYYTVAQATAPAAPTFDSVDFSTGALTNLTTNWSRNLPVIVASNTDLYYQVIYTVTENLRGGIQTKTFGTITTRATFENIQVLGTTITENLQGGDKTSATDLDNSGFYLDKDGNTIFGDANSNFQYVVGSGIKFSGSGGNELKDFDPLNERSTLGGGNHWTDDISSGTSRLTKILYKKGTKVLNLSGIDTGGSDVTVTVSILAVTTSGGVFTPNTTGEFTTTVNGTSGAPAADLGVWINDSSELVFTDPSGDLSDTDLFTITTAEQNNILIDLLVEFSTAPSNLTEVLGDSSTIVSLAGLSTVLAPVDALIYDGATPVGGNVLYSDKGGITLEDGDIDVGSNSKITTSGTTGTTSLVSSFITIRDTAPEIRVIIGATSSTYRSNNGDTRISLSHGTTDGRIALTSAGTIENEKIRFSNSNGEVGSITTEDSSTSYNTSSDHRLKENVVPMSSSIDRLKELSPSRFNFIADDTVTVDGFLAHEAQKVVPECATGTKDGMKEQDVLDEDGNKTGTETVPDYQGIDQAKLVPLLVGALQEAIARIEALENAPT